jgi:hypothetical protein
MSHLDAISMGSRYPWWWRYGDHVEAEIDIRVHTLRLPHTVEGGAAAAQKGGIRAMSCHTISWERSRELWGLNSHWRTSALYFVQSAWQP